MEEQLLTRKQVAQMLSCSVDSVDRLTKAGVLRRRYIDGGADHQYIPSLSRYRLRDVETLIQEKWRDAE